MSKSGSRSTVKGTVVHLMNGKVDLSFEAAQIDHIIQKEHPPQVRPPVVRQKEEKKNSFSFSNLIGWGSHASLRTGQQLWDILRTKKDGIKEIKK